MNLKRYILFLLIIFLSISKNVHCESTDAESHVKDFYHWYIRSRTSVYNSDAFYGYVDVCVSKSLEIKYNRSCFDTDYYTKLQDAAEDLFDILIVHKEININKITSVVPITFKFTEDKQHHLLVFVRKEMDGWRIIKVTGDEYFYE